MYSERLRETAGALREEANSNLELAEGEADAVVQRELRASAANLVELGNTIEQLDYVRSLSPLGPEQSQMSSRTKPHEDRVSCYSDSFRPQNDSAGLSGAF
jgi:hypothetical protein